MSINFDNILIHEGHNIFDDLEYIKYNFCGKVFSIMDNFIINPNNLLYLCGNIEIMLQKLENYDINNELILVVEDFSENYSIKYKIITAGEVPINISGIGIYFRKFFDFEYDNDDDKNKKYLNYFDAITMEHKFQLLNGQNGLNMKNDAPKKGIYLTPINEVTVGIDEKSNCPNIYDKSEEKKGLEYNLLRCTDNLDGPTENFKQIDWIIVNKLNNISEYFFNDSFEFNHVSAKIFENYYEDNLQKKEKIYAHSDKTNDMPDNGLIAFCTFYKIRGCTYRGDKFKNYDISYKDSTILTKLRFEKKINAPLNLPAKIDITLYHDSVLIIPLLTNRFYTHETIPSVHTVERIPFRMSYTVRCSKTKALCVTHNGEEIKDTIYIVDNIEKNEEDDDIPKLKAIQMIPMTDKELKRINELYFLENTTTININYGKFFSSMNTGDYLKPIL